VAGRLAPPHAAEVARLLDGLPSLDDDGGWYRQTILAHLQDLHNHALALLVDLAIDDDAANIEQGWLETFGDRLTPDETSLLRHAVNRPRRIESLLRWRDHGSNDHIEVAADEDDADGDDAVPTPPGHPLLDLADAYHATIVDLFQRATGTLDDDADVVNNKTGADIPAE
jgi:hypothetical protein